MPRRKRNFRKRPSKKMYRRRYKVSVGKLLSKKVDSALERRMVEIAKKEDNKSLVWYRTHFLVKDAQFDWGAHGSILRVPSASCLTINAAQQFHYRLTDIGQLIKNNIDSAADSKTLNNYMRIRSFQCKLDFRYTGAVPAHGVVYIVSVPSSTALDAGGQVVPQADMCPRGGLNLLNSFRQSVLRESVDYKYQIVAKKYVTINPAREYQAAWPINNNNSTTWNQPIHTEKQKFLSIHKSFKGLGKRFSVIESDDRVQRHEYFLCIVFDTVISFNGVVSTLFRLEEPLQSVSLT